MQLLCVITSCFFPEHIQRTVILKTKNKCEMNCRNIGQDNCCLFVIVVQMLKLPQGHLPLYLPLFFLDPSQAFCLNRIIFLMKSRFFSFSFFFLFFLFDVPSIEISGYVTLITVFAFLSCIKIKSRV